MTTYGRGPSSAGVQQNAKSLAHISLRDMSRLPPLLSQVVEQQTNRKNLIPSQNSRMAEPTDAELKELFAPANSNMESDVLAELHSIMRLHSIDAQELWYKWESYSIKMGSDDMKLNIDTARSLKKDVQDALERDNRTKSHSLNTNKRGGATPRNVSNNGDVFGM